MLPLDDKRELGGPNRLTANGIGNRNERDGQYDRVVMFQNFEEKVVGHVDFSSSGGLYPAILNSARCRS